ncbi:MAG: hypothetical protein J7M18_06780 [Candidatus Eremiobacteraeota bacterium]|nr:hypothetical protein [Candidatus Eremiobacteraeota bacterium]
MDINRSMNTGINNPLSAQFINAATRNVSQQMGQLKKQTDVDTDDSMKARDLEDSLDLSVNEEIKTEDHLEAASRTGLLSELEKGKKKDETEKTKQLIYSGSMSPAEEDRESKEIDLKSEMERTIEKLGKLPSGKEKIDNIRKDVPPDKYEAAKKIVHQQIDTKSLEPSESLKALKEVPEANGIRTRPADYHPIMDIHDTMNKPVTVGFE